MLGNTGLLPPSSPAHDHALAPPHSPSPGRRLEPAFPPQDWHRPLGLHRLRRRDLCHRNPLPRENRFHVLPLGQHRRFPHRYRHHPGQALHRHDDRRHRRRPAGAHFLAGLHEGRFREGPLLHRPRPVHVLDDGHRPRIEFHHDLHLLGAGRPQLLPAHRPLV